MIELKMILAVLALTFLLHLFFAAGVFVAARKIRAQGERVMFAPPVVWALHTVIWGLFVVLPYWLIHHSSLRASPRAAS